MDAEYRRKAIRLDRRAKIRKLGSLIRTRAQLDTMVDSDKTLNPMMREAVKAEIIKLCPHLR